MSESAHELQGLPRDRLSRAERMARFVGSVESDDAAMIAFWKAQSPAEHARAGAEISDVTARLAEQRALVREGEPMFPGLSSFLRGA